MLQNLMAATVVIGALRVNSTCWEILHAFLSSADFFKINISGIPSECQISPISQSVASLTAYPGVVSSILALSHTFIEIDRETISTVILLPFADSRRVVASYKQMYECEVLVKRLVKLAQEKVWLAELTVLT